MTEHVFRPSRRVNGKRVLSRLFSGYYSLARGEKPVRVALHTPDEKVARKLLRDIIVDAQRERAGLIPAASIRGSASMALVEHVADYAQDLKGRDLDEKHVHDTLTRLQRVVREAKWETLVDVRADAFVRWRSSLRCSAKTRKEYQISVNAFLNWLVRVDRLAVNPLAKVDRIDTRGKQVRRYRAFTEAEIRLLLASVSPGRRLAYLTLLYTGQRRSEVASLVVEDLTLTGDAPCIRVRIETTKDKDKRAVPLHPSLAAELRIFVPATAAPADLVFPEFPSYDALRADLKRAGVERRDGLGRVVHFHSFRKTWQTLGVNAGVSQRVAQEILGHSDPSLTANVYTDVAALGTHAEIAKLPWFGSAVRRAVDESKPGKLIRFQTIIGELVTLAKAVGEEGFTSDDLLKLGSEKWLPGLGSNQRPSD